MKGLTKKDFISFAIDDLCTGKIDEIKIDDLLKEIYGKGGELYRRSFDVFFCQLKKEMFSNYEFKRDNGVIRCVNQEKAVYTDEELEQISRLF